MQAVDEAVIHDIVHLVRGTFEGSFFADGSCKRMLIALQEFFGSCAVCLSVTHIFQADCGYRIFLCKPSRAADGVRTAVRAWMNGAVLQLDGLSLDGMDEGGVYFSQQVSLLCLGRFFSEIAAGIFRHSHLVGGHGYKVIQTVAPVDIQDLAYRT